MNAGKTVPRINMQLNNCKACDYDKFQNHDGWCYMFRHEPIEVCKKYISSTDIVLKNLNTSVLWIGFNEKKVVK